jgi:peptide/nickel transport system substrate-binding protein
MVATFVPPNRNCPFQMKLWKKIKLVLWKPLFYEKTRKETLHLEAATNLLPDSKVVFTIHTRKIRFHFRPDPSYKDDILTQKGELQPKYKAG